MGQNTRGRRRGLDQQADVAMVGFVGGTGGASVLMAELGQRGLRSKIIILAWQSTERFADECRDRGTRRASRASVPRAREGER